MSDQVLKAGVIGWPIDHSLSPHLHGYWLKEYNINGVYKAFAVEPENLETHLRGLADQGRRGINVTLPHKEAVLAMVDQADDQARKIGAVNTVLNVNGRLKGYNTDGLGAMKALQVKIDLSGKRCVLVGAGGAARGIGFMARESGMELVVVNRSIGRGRALADFLKCPFIPLERIQEVRVDVMIQTTPVGMFPHEDDSPVPDNVFRKEMVVMDAIYNPLETRFLKTARGHGCDTISGLEMFIHQGAEQFRLWTGSNPPMDVMRAVVRKAL